MMFGAIRDDDSRSFPPSEFLIDDRGEHNGITLQAPVSILWPLTATSNQLIHMYNV